jgi:MFS family permease
MIAETTLARKLKLERSIKRFYIYRSIQSLFFLTPILILFLLETGLSMTQVFILEAIYTLVAVLLAIPCGLFSDNFGRKRSIFLSSATMFIACLVYALSFKFYQFLIAEIIWALSYALYMGSEQAFVYDTLLDLERPEDYKKVYGTSAFITLFVFGIASLIGGYIGAISLRLAILATLIPFFIAMFIPVTFVEPKIHKSEKHSLTQLKESLVFVRHHKRIKHLITYFAVLIGITYISFFFVQPYLKAIGFPVKMLGYIYIIGFVLEAMGAKFADLIERKIGEKKSLVSMAFFSAFALLCTGLIWTKIAVIFPLLLFFIYGFADPIISFYINEHIVSHRRGTVMSIKNMARGIVTALVTPLFGYLTDAFSLKTSILTSAGILIFGFVILMIGIFVTKDFEVYS